MLAEVPVSRKRKKKRSGRSGRSPARPRLDVQHQGGDGELARAFQNLAADRDQTDQSRTSRAATMATGLVSNLTQAVNDRQPRAPRGLKHGSSYTWPQADFPSP
jgi:hypothetical protein